MDKEMDIIVIVIGNGQGKMKSHFIPLFFFFALIKRKCPYERFESKYSGSKRKHGQLSISYRSFGSRTLPKK